MIDRNSCGGVFFEIWICTPTPYGYLQAVAGGFFLVGFLISTLFPSVVLDLGMIYQHLGATQRCSVQRQ